MRIAYLDCMNGISGDMFLAACLDAGFKFRVLEDIVKSLGLRNVKLKKTREKRCGLEGVRFQVQTGASAHGERKLKEIITLLKKAKISSTVRKNAQIIFETIANVEAKIHGSTPDHIHFHEIGAIDSLIDIVGACRAIEDLEIGEIYASSVPTGSGYQRTAHGNLPVPAPAALELLKGIPIIIDHRTKELTTPTGAALLKHFSKGFGSPPEMTVQKIGYGVGTWDTAPYPNILRLLIGERSGQEGKNEIDTILVLETNIDDMNPQFISHVFDQLLKAGALDVYLTPIQMKSSRPGIKLSVIIRLEDQGKISKLIFSETTSIGIRLQKMDRIKLNREIIEIQTEFGRVPIKAGYQEGKISTLTPEYRILKEIANRTGHPLKEIYFKVQAEAYKKFSSKK